MAGYRTALLAALSVSAAGLLAACDNGPSAVAQQQAAGTQMAYEDRQERERAAPARSERADRRDEPVKLVDGKPMWAASRRYSAEESARRAFERNGEAFETRSLNQYIRKAHAFVEHPPAGTQTLTRANGDTLFYDPKGNVFAVADKAGAPRTMFKPDDGAAYWRQQKEREERRQTARAERRSQRDDDEA